MHTVIILDHPYGATAGTNEPHHRSLVVAMADAARKGLDAAGHTHETIDLEELQFDPVLSADDLRSWRTGSEPRPDVAEMQRAVARAEHIVLAFPTWRMAPPARTKGFLDRVLTKGFAFEEPKLGGALHRTLHRLRGVSILTAMTTPAPLYGTLFGAPSHRILARGTFQLIGIRRVWFTAIGRSAQRSPASRQRALDRIQRRFASSK